MGKTPRQKELLGQYKERKVAGGVCAVRCPPNGTVLLLAAPDLQAQRNRFAFSVATDAPLLPSMAADWRAHGADSFTFQVLEELEKRPGQSGAEYLADLASLAELRRELLADEGAAFYL